MSLREVQSVPKLGWANNTSFPSFDLVASESGSSFE